MHHLQLGGEAMSGRAALKITAAMTAALLLLPSCSGDGTGVEPGPTRVSMTGSVTFPAGDLVDLAEVTIGLGSENVTADTNGAFTIGANKSAPSMIIAFDQDTIPMLMGIVADPREAAHIEMDLHSTALALAFLSPFVCVSDPDGADDVLSLIEGLPELAELEAVLQARLAANPFALSVEDEVIDAALSDVVEAYMAAYPDKVLENYPLSAGGHEIRRSTASNVVYIDPSYEKSGHRVSFVSQGKFKVTNSLGRWAYCVTPTDSFYVWPNGTLLDALRLDPFRASEREFAMEVIANEPALQVNIYGFGMAPDADNVWDNLGPREQIRARYGGWSTFFFEFIPHVVSVITGANKTVGNKEIAEHWAFKTMQLLSSDARMVERTMMYLREGNMWGMAWFYTKWGLKKILSRDELGETLLGALGITLEAEHLTVLAANLNVAARVVVTSDAVASVIKTFVGYRNSRYKTTFEIWSETVGFGNISGSVHDAADGTPISGARVLVLDDDDNPMEPSHEDFTSESGAFYFSNIQAGDRTLQVSKAGYAAKTVSVTVQSSKTVNVPVTLGKESGSVQGTVINQVLRHNGVVPDNFRGDCSLDAQEIGGAGQTYAYVVTDGQYSKDLSPGNWRLIASHDLYWPDTVEVTVAEDAVAEAPEIILWPRGRMEGQISLDMDGNGTWEKQYSFDSYMVAADLMDLMASGPGGAKTGTYLQVIGATGFYTAPTYEAVNLQIDLGLVTGAGYYDMGGYSEVLSQDYSIPAGVYYLTNKERCYNPASGYMDMIFLVISDPDGVGCNCGITDFGSLVLEQFGTGLTDVVSGGIYADLAGYTNCTCYCCEDLDGDGQEDDWVVDCAKARLSLDFEVVVGSLMSGASREGLRQAGEVRLREVRNPPRE
jgi:hypothetical protein